MNPLDSLSIVIPAFNEADRIGPTLERVLAWMAHHVADGEVLVVDDGSTDGTAEVAGRWPVRVLSNPGNRGKGYSVAHGVAEAQKGFVLFSDADLSTPIEEALVLSRAMEARGVEIAIGSRGLAESNVVRHQPAYRVAMGRTFNRIVQALAVPGIQDTQCGFKLFRADVARTLFSKLQCDGFAFDVEILFLARRAGFQVAEVPVTWVNDDRTRVHAVYDSLRMFRDVVRLRLRHVRIPGREP